MELAVPPNGLGSKWNTARDTGPMPWLAGRGWTDRGVF